MRVLQTVFGVFHHFELARELDRRSHLQAIYSTWPWTRLQREGLPYDKVRTFPWLHVPEYALGRLGPDLPWLTDELGYRNALAFDRWTDTHLHRLIRHHHRPDVLVAISGSSLRAGKSLQRAGGLFLCDRGSTHQRFQEEIVADEFRRWGIAARRVSDPRDTAREEAIYDAADAITVPSTFARRSFLSMGIDPAKIHTVPYGVRLENFAPNGAPPQDEFHVLFAGAVGLRKGVPYLLQAFAALQHPRKRLRLAGALQPEMRAMLHQLPTEDVDLLGPLPQPELATLMSRSHVLVLPSIEEGLALVQAQAMASGCPVLASTNTGAEDLFTDGTEGFIVPIRDPHRLTDRLQQLADSPPLQQAMRAAAQARVQHMGGWSRYGDSWEALLNQLLAAKTG